MILGVGVSTAHPGGKKWRRGEEFAAALLLALWIEHLS